MTNDYFDYIKNGCLITAGKIDNYNSMTIGWGTYGVLWSKNVFIAFVKPCRYTNNFLKDNDYYTVNFFDEKYKKEVMYFGSVSGRDIDKAKSCNFDLVDVKNVGVTFKQAKKTLLVKKIYTDQIDIKNYSKDYLDIIDKYYKIEEPHMVYVGEIIEEL